MCVHRGMYKKKIGINGGGKEERGVGMVLNQVVNLNIPRSYNYR